MGDGCHYRASVTASIAIPAMYIKQKPNMQENPTLG